MKQLTLWDLIKPVIRALAPKAGPAHPSSVRQRPPRPARRPGTRRRVIPAAPAGHSTPAAPVRNPKSEIRAGSMQARYDAVVRAMLDEHRVRVRKWRSSMSGIAWYVTYRDGSVQRLIEAPRPRGPMSAAIFLHEIGHHAIGFDVYKPRCLEEYHAWRWAIEAMQAHGLNITDAVRHRMHMSLWYAVAKAKRRGIRAVPAELTPFLEKPRRAKRPGGDSNARPAA